MPSKRHKARTLPTKTRPQTTARMSAWLPYGVLAVCLAVTVAFWVRWRYGYQSDHAISGLMARSILYRGDRPLFVWTFGYQGIVLEVWAIAVLFKLFGESMLVYYAFTVVCFWLVLYLLHLYVQRSSGELTAKNSGAR